jgi:hypothetical protein
MGISSAPGLEQAEQSGKADQSEPTDQKFVHVMGAQVIDDVGAILASHGIPKCPTAVTPFRAHLITELMPSIVPGAVVTTTAAMAVVIAACARFHTVLLVDRELFPHTDTKFGHLILHCLLLGVTMMRISS